MSQEIAGKEKWKNIWNLEFISICMINAFMNLSKQMSNSILSKYVDSLGAAATTVGFVSSIFAVSALIFKIISGPALDTYNRKYIIIGAMTALGISFTGYSFSSMVPTIVIFRFLQGAAQAFTATCLLTMASETLPPEKFSTGVGMFALFESIAQAIGPTVGLTLVGIIGYQATFAASAILMFLSAAVALFYKYPFQRTKKFRIAWSNVLAGESIPFAVLLFIFNFVFCVVSTYLVIFAGQQGVSEHIGYYFTVYACTLMLSRPLIGRLTDRYGVVKVLMPAMMCFVLSYWMISCSSAMWMFLLAAFISAFGLGACQPAVQALCMKCVPVARRGAASSTCYIAQDLGNLAGASVAGIVIEKWGYVFMWRVMTLPILAAMIYAICLRKRIKSVETAFRN